MPVTPGGETQREMAFRVGVNLVMHALTGNYKDDMVHHATTSCRGCGDERRPPPSPSPSIRCSPWTVLAVLGGIGLVLVLLGLRAGARGTLWRLGSPSSSCWPRSPIPP